jgi:hydroxyacylglutathione hydrolase
MPQSRSGSRVVLLCLALLAGLVGAAAPGAAQPVPAPATASVASTGSLPVRGGTLPPRAWGATRACIGKPDFLIHWYNADLAILRQTACSHPEKNFLYLLFGRDRAILFDTGAEGGNVKAAVRKALRSWLRAHDRRSIPLIVAHSHGHPDHIAGDAQMATLPNTMVVPPNNVPAVQATFGIEDWPEDLGRFELGGRTLDVIPTPGHDATHIAVYDRQTGLLLTADFMYPGRIYINLPDHAITTASADRLVAFAKPRIIAHVLGTHIEQRGPYRDYPIGTTFAPKEQRLELSYGQLLELQQGAHDLDAGGKIVQRAFRDFSICGPYPECNPLLPDGTPRPPQ